MPANLSIKNVPDEWVESLRQRAAKHHRSLQGELLSIIESSVTLESPLSPKDVWMQIRQAGLKTPSESVEIIRKDRDARQGH